MHIVPQNKLRNHSSARVCNYQRRVASNLASKFLRDKANPIAQSEPQNGIEAYTQSGLRVSCYANRYTGDQSIIGASNDHQLINLGHIVDTKLPAHKERAKQKTKTHTNEQNAYNNNAKLDSRSGNFAELHRLHRLAKITTKVANELIEAITTKISNAILRAISTTMPTKMPTKMSTKMSTARLTTISTAILTNITKINEPIMTDRTIEGIEITTKTTKGQQKPSKTVSA
ncbi:hypothetical protein APL35_gp030 [Apis mellifera filamentous virus]|uniref:hypothetical protein n=1 Tax=Apis mellifera filamentous virus TaxID=1100043 RepID=UPI0006BDD2ED|nr:hypothetical protein APL35_gp030 [Apis mellifera filamentous virus]